MGLKLILLTGRPVVKEEVERGHTQRNSLRSLLWPATKLRQIWDWIWNSAWHLRRYSHQICTTESNDIVGDGMKFEFLKLEGTELPSKYLDHVSFVLFRWLGRATEIRWRGVVDLQTGADTLEYFGSNLVFSFGNIKVSNFVVVEAFIKNSNKASVISNFNCWYKINSWTQFKKKKNILGKIRFSSGEHLPNESKKQVPQLGQIPGEQEN